MAKVQEGQSSEVVPWESNSPVPAMIAPTPALVEAAYAAIQDGKLPPELASAEMGDPSITARAIQDRIRASETFEQVFKAQSLPSWQEYEGVPVSVLAFHLNPSSFEGEASSAAYAVVELGLPETGEIVTVQTGGGNVLVQLVKAWEKGWFPFLARLVVKDTRTPGRKTLWLEQVEG